MVMADINQFASICIGEIIDWLTNAHNRLLMAIKTRDGEESDEPQRQVIKHLFSATFL